VGLIAFCYARKTVLRVRIKPAPNRTCMTTSWQTAVRMSSADQRGIPAGPISGHKRSSRSRSQKAAVVRRQERPASKTNKSFTATSHRHRPTSHTMVVPLIS